MRAQHRLVTEHFGISQLAMVSGSSMGGQQTLEWAVRYPDAVAAVAYGYGLPAEDVRGDL